MLIVSKILISCSFFPQNSHQKIYKAVISSTLVKLLTSPSYKHLSFPHWLLIKDRTERPEKEEDKTRRGEVSRVECLIHRILLVGFFPLSSPVSTVESRHHLAIWNATGQGVGGVNGVFCPAGGWVTAERWSINSEPCNDSHKTCQKQEII